jgi:DNA-binding IclR family transcriptional regulator
MRSVHEAYLPTNERFGTRLETMFIGLCIYIGDIEGKPFSVSKIAEYMCVPRTTVMRHIAQLQSWNLVNRQGRRYYVRVEKLNSIMGMRSYERIRRILAETTKGLAALDTLLDAAS